jgi:hypothetical protein
MQTHTQLTQGRRLIRALQLRPHTYMEMLRHGVSISPWKRVCESLRHDERVEKGRDAKGLTTWRVVKAD